MAFAKSTRTKQEMAENWLEKRWSMVLEPADGMRRGDGF